MSDVEIRAAVIPWAQAPSVNSPFAASALLVCNGETGVHRLYVNTSAGYDHTRLAVVANGLIDEFSDGNLDDQWQDCGDGSFARFLPRDPDQNGHTAHAG